MIGLNGPPRQCHGTSLNERRYIAAVFLSVHFGRKVANILAIVEIISVIFKQM
ncbi:hypothetical protein D3C80_894900 [compost metagenome]